MKVLPLLCKRLDLRLARMTTSNGGPVSSRRRKNSVLIYYFRAKYIDTQINKVQSTQGQRRLQKRQLKRGFAMLETLSRLFHLVQFDKSWPIF